MKATKKNRKRTPDPAGKSVPKRNEAAEPLRKTRDGGPAEAVGAKRMLAAAARVGAQKADAQKKERDTASAAERIKLVRDSFTMPREDFDLVATLKARALEFRRPTKKSELLRAGLQLLAAQGDSALRNALEALRPLKAGRPSKKR